jgi:membrane-bound metal-dependent hydrolase YbcI (DUF457 family)
MGRTHALASGTGWLVLAPPAAPLLLGRPLTAAELAAGTLVAAGAGMLNDLDHEDALIATTLGPVTRLAARELGRLAGGHRWGTHTLLFCVAAGFASQALALTAALAAILLGLLPDGPAIQLAVAAAHWVPPHAQLLDVLICYALGLRAIGIARPDSGVRLRWPTVAAAAAALTWATTVFVPGTWLWLGPAIAIGSLLHVLADMLTPGGVPLLLPWSRRRFAFPIISKVNNWQEHLLVEPLLTVALLVLVWVQFPALHSLPTVQGLLELLR